MAMVHVLQTKIGGLTKKINSGRIDLDTAFDGNKCFCLDEYVGKKCEQGREIVLKNPVLGSYENDWDGRVQQNDGNPLCGMEAVHHNDHEDRKFQFRTCDIVESQYAVKSGNDHVTDYTNYDAEFRLECEANKVLIGVESYHHNHYEDRRWRVTCRQFQDSRTENCVGFPNTYVNNWDARVSYTCPSGKVLTGIDSVHSNEAEDRRFRFKCCSLLIHKSRSIDVIEKSGWTGYLNGFDQPFTAYAHMNGKAAAISGISSYHNNHYEDRRFRFKYATAQNMNIKPYSRQTFGYSNWDAYFSMECSGNRALTSFKSYHDNNKEDRRFQSTCDAFYGITASNAYNRWETNQCRWTVAVNNYDQSFDFECGSNEIMTGVISWHNNDTEDRRFRFKCCRWEPVPESNPKSLDA